MKPFKITGFFCVLIATAVTLGSCKKDLAENLATPSAAESQSPEYAAYQTYWTYSDSTKVLLEVRAVNDSVTDIFANGHRTSILDSKRAHTYHELVDALGAFGQAIEQYDCVRLERIDHSPMGYFIPEVTTTWVLIYGDPNEDGECDWAELERNN